MAAAIKYQSISKQYLKPTISQLGLLNDFGGALILAFLFPELHNTLEYHEISSTFAACYFCKVTKS